VPRLPEELIGLGAEVVLANTYHLYLEPGMDVIKKAGGFAKFMNWHGPTMTDSGGFQVFSLGADFDRRVGKFGKGETIPKKADKRKLAKIDDEGVTFYSHLDGSEHRFTPESSMAIQHDLGADMIFVFDECTSPDDPYEYQQKALKRTHAWAERSLMAHTENSEAVKKQGLFGIVQGGRHIDLRKESAKVLAEMPFSGYGIGGSFTKEDIAQVVARVNELLPEEKPKHLLGIGRVEDLFLGIESGIDLFDCVAPTRLGRTGTLYTKNGNLNITNAQFKEDFSPIEEYCTCYTCTNFNRAYLSHLFRSKEMLGARLASIHNLFFTVHLVKNIRQTILDGTFFDFKKEFLAYYQGD
jgi:queuine tRNA-ribosyltransferase